MAKLNRLTAKIFGETASTTNTPKEIGQFGSAKAGTYNATGDVAAIQSLSAWSNGWIDAVTPTDQFPPLPEMTGVHKVLSYQNAYLLQQGIPEWDSATTYYTNNFCAKNGKVYISKSNENLNNDPETDTVNWEERFLNNQQISNCILEAPNGVIDWTSGNTFTVKAGVKVLFANGKNSDGTLNNIEYIIPEDVTLTRSGTTIDEFIVLKESPGEGESFASTWWDRAVFIQEKEPVNLDNIISNSDIAWFQPTSNNWRYLPKNSTSPYSWQVSSPIFLLGYCDRHNTSTIQNVVRYSPLHLLGREDKFEISSWGMPTRNQVEFSLGASGSKYIAPDNGYFYINTYSNADGYIELYNETSNIRIIYRSGTTSNHIIRGIIPVLKGEAVYVNYSTTLSNAVWRFSYAQGARK